MDKVFFTYIDWTLEDPPRPFYVGKGMFTRVRKPMRNVYWQNITAKYGWRREVVLGTKDESFAFEEEKRRIAQLGTFEDGTPGRWGANLTEGGEGCSGLIVSDQTRRKQSLAGKGKKRSSETRKRMSEAKLGASNPMKRVECVEKVRQANLGRKESLDTVEKKRAYQLSLGDNHPMKRPEVRAKFVGDLNPAKRPDVRKLLSEKCPFKRDDVKLLISGENNVNAKLDWDKVRDIRARYAVGGISHRELATMYNVTKRAITCVINNLTWVEQSAKVSKE